jgi:hypothetical protein
MSFSMTVLDDDAPTFDSSFCALLSTSTERDSFEVLTNCPAATLITSSGRESWRGIREGGRPPTWRAAKGEGSARREGERSAYSMSSSGKGIYGEGGRGEGSARLT